MKFQLNDQIEIETGILGAGFWAKYGRFYEGGYLSERQAINALKRKLKAKGLI